MPETKYLSEPRPRSIRAFFLHIRSSLGETWDVRVSEWACGAMLFLLAFVLHFNPALFRDGPSYSAMASLASQDTWKLAFLFGGGFRLLVLLVNGIIRRSPHLRLLAAFVSCGFWFQIALGLYQSGTFPTGMAIYPVLLGLDFYHLLRCGRAARRVDDYLALQVKE
ncbi:hypothetical protein [Aureimonas leprariae]|uniref:Uncharacterized protein n=1 Tax=Plantimonas leprariae TaxID=2615207 RepID=A0A7V7PSF1_9HYPH|nr:hypothetical protein [Aureimonas leprariae]KAB0682006.1 hypothetical protein F6X38_04155 [Aureimonas leprariae]